jgi:hypothetical protein
MGKYLYLIVMAILGLTISAFSFHKSGVYFSEINQFIDGDKTLYELIIEPKDSLEKTASTEKSYLNTDYTDYHGNTDNTDNFSSCAKLDGASTFVKIYLLDFVNLNTPLSLNEQIKNIKLLKEFDSFIQSEFYIQRKYNYISLQFRGDHSCNTSLQVLSDMVYKIASVSSKGKIKELSRFIASPLINFYEYENIVISYPFVFYFENGDLLDFKYLSPKDSHKAQDYIL